jgi:glucose-1-phosphate adenylyltransferase
MDYAKMLDFHKKKNADCTIAVFEVPMEEASRFGIMSANEDGSIYKFSEKPKNPDSNKASMGIYIFNKDKLESYLREDSKDPESANDFGKNIIPAMLANKERMFAYPFEGYWKDVGTISSLWEANMDLLGNRPILSLSDEEWRIYSRHGAAAPQFVGEDASVINSSVTAGCEILGEVRNSVLGPGVRVGKGAVVADSVIMADVTIEDGATVCYSILDENVTVGKNATVGESRETASDIAVIGADVSVDAGSVVPAGAMISEKV